MIIKKEFLFDKMVKWKNKEIWKFRNKAMVEAI